MNSADRATILASLTTFCIDRLVELSDKCKADAHLRAVNTDQFHPVDTDCTLDEATTQDELIDSTIQMGEEIVERIIDIYANRWNHPPGYVIPSDLDMVDDYHDLLTEWAEAFAETKQLVL